VSRDHERLVKPRHAGRLILVRIAGTLGAVVLDSRVLVMHHYAEEPEDLLVWVRRPGRLGAGLPVVRFRPDGRREY
jgi:hypothetical protein